MEFLSKGENNYLKAKYYIQIGKFSKALYNLRIAESKNFDLEKILLLRGIVDLYKMNIGKAFETFQRVLTFTNRNPDVYYYIGICFNYFGNEEEAYDNFIKAYKYSNNELIKGKSILNLLKICNNDKDKLKDINFENYFCMVKINKDDDEIYRSNAINEMLKENYIKASEILKELINKQAKNFEAYKDLAFVFSKLENYDFALKSLKKAKFICRKDKTISLELARVYFYLKNYFEARIQMKKVIKKFPPHYKNFYNMGNICSLLNRTTEAVGYYKKSIAINEHFTDAYFNMATVYHNEGMLNEGEKYYKMAQQTCSNRAEIHYNLGLLHCFKKNYFEALNHMLYATKIYPGYENALHNYKVIKNIKLLNQEDEFKESLPFNTKVLITFISIILFLIIAYILRLLNI